MSEWMDVYVPDIDEIDYYHSIIDLRLYEEMVCDVDSANDYYVDYP